MKTLAHSSILILILSLLGTTQCSRFSKTDKADALQTLQQVNERNKAFIPLTYDDERMLLHALEVLRNEGTSNERVRAYYLLGSVYRDLHDAPLALHSFQRALEQADTLDANCDFSLLEKVCGQMGDVLKRQCLVEEATEAYHQSQHFALLVGDTCSMLDSELSILGMAYLKGHPDSLAHRALSILHRYHELGDTVNSARRMLPSVFACMEASDTVTAAYLLDIYERYSDDVTAETFDSESPFYHYAKGRLSLMEGELVSAEVLLRKAFTHAHDWNTLQGLYREMNKLYQAYGICDSALKYAQLQCMSVDSDYQEKVALNLQQMKCLYDYTLHQQNAQRLSKEIEQKDRKHRMMVLLFVAAVLTGSIAFVHFRLRMQYRHLRDIERLKETKLQQSRLESELAQNKLILKELQEQQLQENEKQQINLAHIKEELSERQRLLTVRQKELENITKALYSLSPSEDSDLTVSSIILLMKDVVSKDQLPNEEHWSRLTALVLAAYPTFLSKLHEQLVGISERDVRVCILIKLETFSMLEISKLICCHISTLTHIRTRLYAKAHGGNKASAQKADEWIRSL